MIRSEHCGDSLIFVLLHLIIDNTVCGIYASDHKYIDEINYNKGSSERLIIDIDFRSHFELMVDAAGSSLKQNSMPFPPWRSLAYLQAKWQSPYQRQSTPNEHDLEDNVSSDNKQCNGHLRGLHSSPQSELEAERLLKPMNIDSHCRLKLWITNYTEND
ncbi:Uncharacterized protein TCM_042766 [Theobroma cacao]|uniref:Uncharacterized protein n=1 Tax=Theobroma cacao TaxID=3641 RepID=A0A061FTW9_THECC|nr:Uncharacterized protein TCM_042766 [Theobroma cacao]